MDRRRIIITCEHSGNKVPAQFKFLFKKKESVLESHLGWDPGAHQIAKHLSESLKVKFHYQGYSRLLIECNRSPDNPELFSKYTQGLNELIKDYLIKKYYLTYRGKVERDIGRSADKGISVLHLSVHSYAPTVNGVRRKADIGLLFDPSREKEKKFCSQLKKEIDQQNHGLKVKYNYPYLGTADGFTTYLRRKWPDELYSGIEIEINQAMTGWPARKKMQSILSKCLRKVYFDASHIP